MFCNASSNVLFNIFNKMNSDLAYFDVSHNIEILHFNDLNEFCKVEFIQPSNWLYSVPNLLVIQHLVTLYLGGFDVRVVSEIERRLLKSVQENRDSQLGLAAASRQKQHTCQACWKMNSHASWSTTGQNRTTGHTVISRLDLAT